MTADSLPPRGMTWVTWRQHRTALAGVLAVLGGLSLLLALSGPGIHATYRALGLTHCHTFETGPCAQLADKFAGQYAGWRQIEDFPVLLPGLFGMFVGAPLLAREFAAGTFRFAWTQGAGRTRWTLTKLILLAGALTTATLAFSLLFSWWYQPFLPTVGRMQPGRAFESEGLVFTAQTLFGITLGAFLGVVIRRVVPAMATTIAVWLTIEISVSNFLRPHYLTPITGPDPRAGTGLVVDQWWVDPAGHRLSQGQYDALAVQLSHQGQNTDAWLAAHRYVPWATYQPDSRFWTFQIIESSGLCVLALLLGTTTLWWVRRRAT